VIHFLFDDGVDSVFAASVRNHFLHAQIKYDGIFFGRQRFLQNFHLAGQIQSFVKKDPCVGQGLEVLTCLIFRVKDRGAVLFFG
jgi:hypothetical protein